MKNDVIGLLKYNKIEFCSDFEDGNIYFNDLLYYQTNEEKFIGDKNEGKIVNNLNPDDKLIIIKAVDSKEYHILPNITSLSHNYSHSIYKNIKISCYTIIRKSDIETDKIENGIEIYRFKESFLDSLPVYEDERNIYICNDINMFCKSLANECSEEVNTMIAKQVHYYNSKNTYFEKMKNGSYSYDDLLNAAFEKDIKYQSQREFRILVEGLVGNKIYLPDINDYWFHVEDIKNQRIGLLDND